jgi:hypothetical protein
MTTEEFFELIYGDAPGPGMRICVFYLPGEVSRFFESTADAARYVATLDPGLDIYHGLSLVGGSPRGRGKAEETVAYGTLWADVDVLGGPHEGNLPPDKDAALRFLDGLPVPPSLVVDSGFGIHGYWPLDEANLFGDAEARKEAARVAKGWHGLVCDAARAHGWALQNLGDLPRVLRTPGTLNNKQGAGLPVTVVRCTGEVFGLAALAAQIPQDAPQRPAAPLPMVATPGDALRRCLLYLDEVPGAIQGCSGGAQTLVACKAIFRFGLDGAEARAAFDHYNQRCVPPWENEKEIAHKLADAAKSVDAAGERGQWLAKDRVELGDPVGELAAQAFLAPREDLAPDPGPELVPGLLGDIIRWNLDTAMYPQPELALGGALALLGVITGQRVRDSRGTRTNIYTLGIAPSGAGKEHARQINKSILAHACAESERMLGPERIGSHAGIVSAVGSNPTTLFQIDEFGKLLATMRSASKQPHLYNIASVLLQLYSSASTVWIGDAYADAKKVKRIVQPHACIYGSSTPADFWDGLTRENVSEGLLGRLLVFEGGYVDRRNPSCDPPPDGILERVRKWIELRPAAGGNLGSVVPVAQVMETARDAQRRLDSHLDAICDRRRSDPPVEAAVWSRSGEKTAKLALMFACSRWEGSGDLPRVELQDVDRAIQITNRLTRYMLRKAFQHVAENDVEHKSKKLLRSITGEVTASELTRRTQWLRAKERNEIINDLIAAGYLVSAQRETSGRPVTIFKLPDLKEGVASLNHAQPINVHKSNLSGVI